MPQELFSLWTVPADDVTGGANASEEIHTDCRRGGSRGNIGQVHIHADFPSRGRLQACDRRECESLKTKIREIYKYLISFTPHTWTG